MPEKAGNKMVKCDLGHTEIMGSGALVAAEMETLIEAFINATIEKDEDRESAEETVDKIVENAKESAKISAHKSEESDLDRAIGELAKKIMKDILGGM